MKRVCLVGVGLIGGSLGMALRRVRRNGKRAYVVSGLGRSQSVLRRAEHLGAVDDFSVRAKSVVTAADVVVLCVPVEKMALIAKKIRPLMKRGVVLTDVGSVKKAIVSKLGSPTFVGAHPIAGSEKTGVQNARADLFAGATCVLARDRASKTSLATVGRLWRDVGSTVVITSAAEHDRILALTSHLPHLIAFGLFSLVWNFSKKNARARRLAGPSFQDVTRIAASHPDVWTGIVDMNRRELSRGVADFTAALRSLSRLPAPRLRRMLTVLSRAKRTWSS